MIRAGLFILVAGALGVLAACVPQPWPQMPRENPGAAAPLPGRAALASHPDRVTVAPGDTLYALAQRYRVPVRAVIDANRLQPPYRLMAGAVLVLPQSAAYVVRPGETLNGVARAQGVDVSTLARTNHLAPPYRLRRGQVLVLPGTVAALPRPAPPPQRAAMPLPAAPSSAVAAAPRPPNLPPVVSHPVAPASPPVARLAALPPPMPLSAAPPAAESPLAPLDSASFLWPVRGRILASYGPATNGTQNDGINIAAPEGTPVLAAAAGTVVYAGNELRGYGNLVLIKHENGFVTAYAHNQVLLVHRGEAVRRGQAIAKVGMTGAVGAPQLHFEIRRGTHALDPVAYLPALSASAANGF